MSLTSEEITAKNFKKFYTELLPYLGSYDKGKLTFVGEVKAFFAETAPNGFLICDGATYNKADYPQLANLLLSLTDHSAYEVSGDNTKFKVPDLRGEFLRGTGVNSHANQGSGAGVGEHQDGTEHFHSFGNKINAILITDELKTIDNINADTYEGKARRYVDTNSVVSSTDVTGVYTSRPTNTSVLFCIAYKDTMVDLDFLSYGGERFAKSDMYDTNERPIGKWIDGKPLYKKTVDCGALPNATTKSVAHGISDWEKTISIEGYGTNGSNCISIPYVGGSTSDIRVFTDATNITIVSASNVSNYSAYVTLIYTKTTDTADSFKYSTPTDYSTKEKIVGTDVDGKPVYQKTVNFTTPSAFNTFVTVTTITALNLIECIFNGIQYSSTQKAFPLHDIYYFQDGNVIKFAVVADNGMLNKSARITIRYTKTTD